MQFLPDCNAMLQDCVCVFTVLLKSPGFAAGFFFVAQKSQFAFMLFQHKNRKSSIGQKQPTTAPALNWDTVSFQHSWTGVCLKRRFFVVSAAPRIHNDQSGS